MNRERAKELLPIITAFANGEVIQEKIGTKDWYDHETPDFEVDGYEWRIKPKPREFYVCWDNDDEPEDAYTEPNERKANKYDNYIKVREVL